MHYGPGFRKWVVQGGSGGAGNGIPDFLSGEHVQHRPPFMGAGRNSNTMGAFLCCSEFHACAIAPAKCEASPVHMCRLTRRPSQLLGSDQACQHRCQPR
jgi:hypothetical protein